MKQNILILTEHQSFNEALIAQEWQDRSDSLDRQNSQDQAKKFFQSLEDFAKNNSKFLTYKRKGELKTLNYVGTIQTRYGTLEILPKCFKEDSKPLQYPCQEGYAQKLKEHYQWENFQNNFAQDLQECQDQTKHSLAKRLLLNLLKTLKDLPFKQSQLSAIEVAKIPLLEIFIRMFCEEVQKLYHRGIKRDYLSLQENRRYLKGKLLITKQIRHNLTHKERFFTQSDEYLADIPPNRLIVLALQTLKKQTHNPEILKILNQNLDLFDPIEPSKNPKKDFLNSHLSRHFHYYHQVLQWCKIFLNQQSFTNYRGSEATYALLFPMEKLFESYVATMLKRHNPHLRLTTQSTKRYLLQRENKSLFCLRPDILFESNNQCLILDTKWKMLSLSNPDISQSDLYQMWAYATHYGAKEVWLIYPLYPFEDLQTHSSDFGEFHQPKLWEGYISEVKVKLKILFAPLPIL